MAEIIRAEHAGFCFGVKQAIEKTEEAIRTYQGKQIYTCGPIIHNQYVIDSLASQGVGIVHSPEEAVPGDVVIVRSHGETRDFFGGRKSKVFASETRPVLSSKKFISWSAKRLQREKISSLSATARIRR